jgi:hypothetical protein
MAKRSKEQKIGARGQRWLLAKIEEHPHWLARSLDEDYGIDLEAELTENDLRGEILKIQAKASEIIERKDGRVKVEIDRAYVDYAQSCRYPFILVFVDLHTKQAWYLWLQDWILKKRAESALSTTNQQRWVEWIPDQQTIDNGLAGELKSIALWKGETQLVLSLRDALRAAAGSHKKETIEALVRAIEENAPKVADTSLDVLIEEAIALGDRMRGTLEGNIIADQMFALVRRYGDRVSRSTVHNLVIRGDSFSRAGVTALGILYDEFPEHLKSLDLLEYFTPIEPRVAFYCAYREAFPSIASTNILANPSDFTFAGLRYVQPDMHWDKYANRGPSALLEYLVVENQV